MAVSRRLWTKHNDLARDSEKLKGKMQGQLGQVQSWPHPHAGGELADQRGYVCATECGHSLFHIQLSWEIHRTQDQFGQLTLRILFLWEHSQNQSLSVIYD